jgi:hypothetical protein
MVSNWDMLLMPYLNVAITNEWTEAVMDDCRNKLSGLDEKTQMKVVHCLLMNGDYSDLLKDLLKIAIGCEDRYALPVGCGTAVVTEKTLIGGDAFHFAVLNERIQCLKALMEAGASAVLTKNSAGKVLSRLPLKRK